MSEDIRSFFKLKNEYNKVNYTVLSESDLGKYREQLIHFNGEAGDSIPAYLLIPNGEGPFPAVQIHHQHAGERHFGKSEVVGRVGDQFQAFGLALANQGFVVLSADSICFEDRRFNQKGTEPCDKDWEQHFNEMTYRLVRGDTLMRKVLSDASFGISLLTHLPFVQKERVGVLGHSYGGNTALFQSALDDRISFTCTSGAVCSYKNKMQNQTSFEFALAIPGFVEKFDFDDLLSAIAPRRVLVVSANDDKYSKDADVIVTHAQPAFDVLNVPSSLVHKRYNGGHSLDAERFEFIVNWVASCKE